MKRLKFSNINENDVIEEIEALEERNEFSCVLNACPVNASDCLINTGFPTCMGIV
ncbi:hypothetical protein G4W71_05095 [Clostridium botulinum]|uniref:hypothetical protein n=1 Tax=Clostridium botulinum TaxID=1491 RepID=UPI001788C5ED|nr:hypothetical protein [Clostridium botulinum]MBE1303414.1 hypothetical protein [Clostridium botulinum]